MNNSPTTINKTNRDKDIRVEKDRRSNNVENVVHNKKKKRRNQKRSRPGRPPKNTPSQEEACSAERELQLLYNELSDNEEAECVRNGFKMIECFICGDHLSKIYKLRQHMQDHANVDNYDHQLLGMAPIYNTLNPHRRNIEASVIHNFIIKEIREKRYSQFYGILTETGIELHISDSETDSEGDEDRTGHSGEKQIPCNTYKCDLCQENFDRRYKALFHQKISHSDCNLHIACDYCGRQYIGIQLLIHHLKTQCESDERPISCVERFRQYLLKVNLEQFECLAQARKELKMHRLTTAEKLYSCNICQKTFLRPEHLTRHKAVHLPDELKMECPVCFKKFNRKDNLRTHMKVHIEEAERDNSNDQSILCQYCGHCFTSKSNYVVHMRRHTGEKPYTCDVCGKGFPKSTDLNSHKITHSGERNFSCSICKKTFARSAVLSKHMRVHMGPYHCTYCDQSYQRPNELANHLRHHASGQLHICRTCSNNFGTKEQLDVHIQESGHNKDAQNSNAFITEPSPISNEITSSVAERRPELLQIDVVELPADTSSVMMQNTFPPGGGSLQTTQPPNLESHNFYQNWQ